MAADPNTVEQAVSRTLRDNLERIQRSAEELHQAVNDLVSACASSRPANALPPMIRAHTSAASLCAALEVLSRFVTSAMPSGSRQAMDQEIPRATSPVAAELPAPVVAPEAAPMHPMGENPWTAPAAVEQIPAAVEMPSVVETPVISHVAPVAEMRLVADVPPAAEPIFVSEPVPVLEPVLTVAGRQESQPAEAEPIFSLDLLPLEEQELHRRAYRVAKVSMQDIKMLRPEDVRVGRENKDLCSRLRDDIEKAHKEYDRRFQSIQSHPVDYFYDWMVEILAGGDPQALGEYPYPSPVMHR